MAQKPHFAPKSESCIKCMSFPLAATAARDNSALDDASEVIASTKGQNFCLKFGWILGWNMKL